MTEDNTSHHLSPERTWLKLSRLLVAVVVTALTIGCTISHWVNLLRTEPERFDGFGGLFCIGGTVGLFLLQIIVFLPLILLLTAKLNYTKIVVAIQICSLIAPFATLIAALLAYLLLPASVSHTGP